MSKSYDGKRKASHPTKQVKSPVKSQGFTVKPVYGHEIAGIILRHLSKEHPDICNYHVASELARRGEVYLAYLAVEEANERIAETSARHVWVKAQAIAALKKLSDRDLDRWEATKSLWFSTEHKCKRQNQKLLAFLKRRALGNKPLPYSRELARFYQFLIEVLGEDPPVDEILQAAHYGPGSSVGVRGRATHYVRKSGSYECVPLAVELAASALAHDKATWAHIGMDPVYAGNPDALTGYLRVMKETLSQHVVQHDVLMFIHKNINSLRSIGAQPTCSGMLQLGVHTVVAERLKSVGITIDDQSKNKKLAYIGSRDWEELDPICTLDKSNASNTLCKALIQFFPPAWAKLLLRIRTPLYEAPPEIGGGIHSYEMYAGMGNGTTFVVETLVFAAMAYASSDAETVKEFVSSCTYAVYGDDVILRRAHARRYMALAEWMGFRFNREKTFTEGRFRESCGADYFEGVDVRPAYVRASEGRAVHELELIGVHNTLADQPSWCLKGACEEIRRLWAGRINPLVPTDPSGNTGFRPIDTSGYSRVRRKDGEPVISPTWQRPRFYTVNIRPRFEGLGTLDPWTQMAVALMRGRQEGINGATWSLPVRDLVNIKLLPESDLVRSDLLLMLRNTLSSLAGRKTQPWFEASRGRD